MVPSDVPLLSVTGSDVTAVYVRLALLPTVNPAFAVISYFPDPRDFMFTLFVESELTERLGDILIDEFLFIIE